ncbi:MAG TPA: hypothetical protein VG753_03340 [Candidatus Paceibacterota bacterium]|nr:hypothetical protein [Candidatus Paceibacterota bacterium]
MKKFFAVLGAVVGASVVLGTAIMYHAADAAFLADPTSTVAHQNYVDTFVLAMFGLAIGTAIMVVSFTKGTQD